MAAHPTPEPGSPYSSAPAGSTRLLLLLIGVLVLLASGICVVANRPTRDGAITKRSDLQKLPEEHLFYPGATLLGSGGNDYERGIWGSNAATWGQTLGVDASKEEVLAFYDRELTARGWQKTSADGVATSELAVEGWRKDGVAIRIAILRQGDPRNMQEIDAYQTGYELALFGARP